MKAARMRMIVPFDVHLVSVRRLSGGPFSASAFMVNVFETLQSIRALVKQIIFQKLLSYFRIGCVYSWRSCFLYRCFYYIILEFCIASTFVAPILTPPYLLPSSSDPPPRHHYHHRLPSYRLPAPAPHTRRRGSLPICKSRPGLIHPRSARPAREHTARPGRIFRQGTAALAIGVEERIDPAGAVWSRRSIQAGRIGARPM